VKTQDGATHCDIFLSHNRKDRPLVRVADDDLIRLGPAGFVHLELIHNINYLAAVAEDTYFSDRIQAERVVERMRNVEQHFHLANVSGNAEEIVEFLDSLRPSLNPPKGAFIQDTLLEKLSSLSEAREALLRISKSQSWDPWFGADKRFPRSSRQIGLVINIVDYGCFVEFDVGLVGLAHKNQWADVRVDFGDRVEVEILWVANVDRKMGLRLIAIVQEDAGDPVGGGLNQQGTLNL
jgi:hypothetical protein